MKFIFPKNYNFKSKILGVIDYSTAIFNLVILFVIFFILNLLIKDISVKIFFIILLYLPILLLSMFCSQNESIVFVIFYIIKFLLKPRIYLYQ